MARKVASASFIIRKLRGRNHAAHRFIAGNQRFQLSHPHSSCTIGKVLGRVENYCAPDRNLSQHASTRCAPHGVEVGRARHERPGKLAGCHRAQRQALEVRTEQSIRTANINPAARDWQAADSCSAAASPNPDARKIGPPRGSDIRLRIAGSRLHGASRGNAGLRYPVAGRHG